MKYNVYSDWTGEKIASYDTYEEANSCVTDLSPPRSTSENWVAAYIVEENDDAPPREG